MCVQYLIRRQRRVFKMLQVYILGILFAYFVFMIYWFHKDLKLVLPLQAVKEVKDTDSGLWAYFRRQSTNQTCLHPVLDPFQPSIMQFYQQQPRVNCSDNMKDWVYTTNGTFYISQEAILTHGDIACEYLPLLRRGDFTIQYGPPLSPVTDGTPLRSDFFKVNCESSSGRLYSQVHSAVAWNKAVHARLEEFRARRAAATSFSSSSSTETTSASPSNASRAGNFSQIPGLNLSVFIFGLDSMSRMSWIRLLPRTRRYFLHALGGVELEGYNIVGDGTPAALLPILTGRSEEELPEARRGVLGARPVDGHPWVWNEFRRHGYVTADAEDMTGIGAFHLRMLGFQEQPTDHYHRPFQIAAERLYKDNPPFCLGSKPRHMIFINWFEDLFDMYKNYPKFFFGFHAEMSHGSNNPVQAIDLDMESFLHRLEEKGHLNSTLLILMADHGARFSYVRSTVQGKLEERMPYFAFRFPPWLKKTHPQLVKNFQINTHRLTTPFDIHQTLLEVLAYTGSGVANISQRAVSLFKEIPQNRSCSHAGVTPHWCACLDWIAMKTSDNVIQSAVKAALSAINVYTKQTTATCAQLHLTEVTSAARYTPSREDYLAEQQVRAFESLIPGQVGSGPEGRAGGRREIYQVSFVTMPGNGKFEATCTRYIPSGTFSVAITDISRINPYGKDADCVVKSDPHLRPFCYCV